MTKQELQNFATRLQYLRNLEGITQRVLADRLNISRSCLANYERGKRQPDEQILLLMARYFNVTVEYLKGNETAYVQLFSAAEYIQDLKRILPDGKLDLTELSLADRISVVDFFNYLKYQEANLRQGSFECS